MVQPLLPTGRKEGPEAIPILLLAKGNARQLPYHFVCMSRHLSISAVARHPLSKFLQAGFHLLQLLDLGVLGTKVCRQDCLSLPNGMQGFRNSTPRSQKRGRLSPSEDRQADSATPRSSEHALSHPLLPLGEGLKDLEGMA